MKKFIKLSAFVVVAALISTSCNKDKGTGNMTVKMTDDPAVYDSVNVEVLSVEVHYADNSLGSSGWVTLPTISGIYNLLDLQNDITTVLVNNNELPAGSITQMRLILGSRNWVVVEGLPFPLELSSQSNTGIKINANVSISPGDSVEVLLDFDAGESIVVQGNGTYLLKPVIRLESVVVL